MPNSVARIGGTETAIAAQCRVPRRAGQPVKDDCAVVLRAAHDLAGVWVRRSAVELRNPEAIIHVYPTTRLAGHRVVVPPDGRYVVCTEQPTVVAEVDDLVSCVVESGVGNDHVLVGVSRLS